MIRPLARARLMTFSLASFVPATPGTTAATPGIAPSTHVATAGTRNGPFAQSHVQIALSKRFNRVTPHPNPSIDAAIEQLWTQHTRQSPRLFNGTKFRLHDWHMDASHKTLQMQCGLTDYKTYLGTCCADHVAALRTDGKVHCDGHATAFLSRKIGVSGVVETSDRRVALIERSRSVGVYQQLVDTPGGHPEPSDLPFTLDELEALDEGSDRATALEAQAVARLFGSIVDEVYEEINVSPAQLSAPLLLGIVFQSEAETPSFVFHMTTPLSSTDVEALYRLGPQDKFESTRLCWVDETTLDRYRLTPAAQGSLSLWQQYNAFRVHTTGNTRE